jgi:hypothetical protein
MSDQPDSRTPAGAEALTAWAKARRRHPEFGDDDDDDDVYDASDED